MPKLQFVLAALVMLVAASSSTLAEITTYTSLADFNSAVGTHPVIAFTEYPVGTALTSQYSSLGVSMFWNLNDTIVSGSDYADGRGARSGGAGWFDLALSDPRWAIGAEFPGTALEIAMWYQGNAVGVVNIAGSGPGSFAGAVSSDPFDGVVLFNYTVSNTLIDNLHLGPSAVPEPGPLIVLSGLGVMGLIAAWRRGKRAG